MNTKGISRRRFSAALAAGTAVLLAPRTHAQAWPAKPIKVIVPYTPGGFTDITARVVCQKLHERLGQPVVIENKPGANSIIGVDAVAKSPPDGYTFAVVIAAYAANTTLYPKLPYDPKKDLAAVSLIGQHARGLCGLVLSTDLRPHPNVLKLLQESELPAIVSPLDSYSIASLIHSMTVKTLPGDNEKIQRIQSLVEQHVNVRRIVERL